MVPYFPSSAPFFPQKFLKIFFDRFFNLIWVVSQKLLTINPKMKVFRGVFILFPTKFSLFYDSCHF